MEEQMADDIEAWKDMYRTRNCLPPDTPVDVLLGGDSRTAYVYDPSTWRFEDGGTLDLGIWRDSGCRCRWAATRRAHRIWSWLRWGGWRR